MTTITDRNFEQRLLVMIMKTQRKTKPLTKICHRTHIFFLFSFLRKLFASLDEIQDMIGS